MVSRTAATGAGAARVLPPPPLRDRLIVLVSLAGVIGLSWYFLATFDMTGPMPMAGMADAANGSHAGMDMVMSMTAGMDGMPMAPLSFGLLAAMWIVMMIGMMLPSAIPMVLMATRMGRARQDAGGPAFATGAFVGGYLLAWAGFSLAAAAVQTGLQGGIVSGHEMAIATAPIAGGVLIAAGLYQWTPLKHVCLAKCRSPLGFFLSHWRAGVAGALRMGLHHGLYCIGCCWLLMALLFVAGVMALPWVGALGALVLIEKIAPKGGWVARFGGLAMVGAGVYLIVAG